MNFGKDGGKSGGKSSGKNRRMKTGFHVAFTYALLVLAMTTNAAELTWYTGFETSVGRMLMDDNSHDDSIGTGQSINGIVDGALVERDVRDWSNGLGLSFGVESGGWRVEAEGIWRYRSDWDLSAITPSIGTVINVFTNLGTTTLMFNGMRQGQLAGNWYWEAGAGIGVVRKKFAAEYIERAQSRAQPDFIVERNKTAHDFAWQVFAGLAWQFGDHWALHSRYRFMDLGDLEAGPFPGRAARVNGDLASHELTIGFQYR
jgi:opacity protein-like surface antigen